VTTTGGTAERVRWRRALAVAAALAVVAGACDGDDDGGSATPPTTATGPATATGGCASARLAFLGPTSGGDAASGTDQAHAVELAISEFNAAHPTCRVELRTFDTASSAAATTIVAQEIARDPTIVGVVGPMSTGASLAAVPILQAAGVAVITPAAWDRALATRGWRVFHQAVADTGDEAVALARHVTGALAARDVAVLHDATPGGVRRAERVEEAVAEDGATVTVSGALDAEARDQAATLAELDEVGADVVVFVGAADVAAALTTALRESGSDVDVVVGGEGLEPAYLVGAGPAAEGVAIVGPALASVAGYPGGPAFATRFETATGQSPGLFAAEAYDAAGFLLAALGEGAATRADVGAYLLEHRHDGVTKQLAFEPDGGLAGDPPVYANTVEDGLLVGLGPVAD
jgi:branched-chain amino acid transport system substrate-binding protein